MAIIKYGLSQFKRILTSTSTDEQLWRMKLGTQSGISGKVGGMKSSPRHGENGVASSWTVTFALLEAQPLPGAPHSPDPLPPDVPVRIIVKDDPTVFNSYVAEAQGQWNQTTNFFEADIVKVPGLGIILRPIETSYTGLIVLIIIFVVVIGGLALVIGGTV